MDWSSKLWASGKHLSLLSLWQQNIQRRNLSKNARRNLVEVPDFWNDDDTDEDDDDNWVDVHVCNKTTLFENNDHWMVVGPLLQPYFLPAANPNGNGMFQIEILITTAAVDSFALPHKRIDL